MFIGYRPKKIHGIKEKRKEIPLERLRILIVIE